jgi:peptidoglycan hydrolase CwlO-like protein
MNEQKQKGEESLLKKRNEKQKELWTLLHENARIEQKIGDLKKEIESIYEKLDPK